MKKTATGKNALLLWAKKVLENYPNVDMKDFSLSWRDGIAFLGILAEFLGEKKVPGMKFKISKYFRCKTIKTTF